MLTNEEILQIKNDIINQTFNISKVNQPLQNKIKSFTTKHNIIKILTCIVLEYEFISNNNNFRDFYKFLEIPKKSKQEINFKKYPNLYAEIKNYIETMPIEIRNKITFGEQIDCWLDNSYEKYSWIVGKEGYDYLVCPVCNSRLQEISFNHVKMHGFNSVAEFLKKYNMKTNKAQYHCDRLKGENNPGYQHGGKYSPYSEKFINYQHLDEQERKKVAHEKMICALDSIPVEKQNTRIEYYMHKGMTYEEAVKARANRQSTFSLDKCIDRLGQEEGQKRFLKRQTQWLKTLDDKTEEEKERILRLKATTKKGGKSKIAIELCKALDRPGAFWGTVDKNQPGEKMFAVNEGAVKRIMVDFCFENKIIEFYGDYWHQNPVRFKPTNKIISRSDGDKKFITAQEKWNLDAQRVHWLENKGYMVKIIWEHDYRKNSDKIVKECLEFLSN